MGKQRTRSNPFVTNTYSNYVPAYVGDTVQEQALLMKTQANKFDLAKQGYVQQENALSLIQTAPNKEYFPEQAGRDFDSSFEEAKEQGNFEDMVGKSDELAKDLYSQYGLGTVISEGRKYREDLQGIDDSDLPLDLKEFQKLEIQNENPPLQFDDDGNPIFVPYRSNSDLEYVEGGISKEVDSILKGWQKDGFLEKDKVTGEYTVLRDLVVGKAILEKDKIANPTDIRQFILEYLRNDPKMDRAIRDEAKVKVKGAFYRKGEYSKEDAMNLALSNNPFREDTEEYKNYNQRASDIFDTILMGRLDTTEKRDIQEEIVNAGIGMQDAILRHTYAGMGANKYGSLDESLLSYDLDDPEGSGDLIEIPDMSGGTFSNIIVGTGNSSTIHNGELLKEKRTNLEAKKALLNEKENSKDAIGQHELDRLEHEVELAERDVERFKNSIFYSAQHLYTKIEEEFGVGGGKDYDTFKEEKYEKYLKEVNQEKRPGTISFGAAPIEYTTKTHQDLYQQLYPNTQFEDDRTPLTKEQFFELTDTQFVNNATNKGKYNKSFMSQYGLDVKRYVDKSKNPEKMFKNYQVYDYELFDSNDKQREPFKEFGRVKAILNDYVVDNIDIFETTEGKQLSEIMKYKGIDKTIKVDLLSTNINGELGARVIIPKTNEQDEIEAVISLNDGSNNYNIIKNRIGQAISGIMGNLLLQDKLTPDQENAFIASNSIMNTLDGSRSEFDSLPLYTAPEGSLHSMPIGKERFTFSPYKYGNENRNRTLIMKEDTWGVTADKDNTSKISNTGLGVLGWHINNTENGVGMPGVKPIYILHNNDPNKSPYTIKKDNPNQIVVSDWFIPADYGTPMETFERISAAEAQKRGTLDKLAIDEKTLARNPEVWYRDYSDSSNIENRISDLNDKGYTRDRGYIPLTDVIHPALISTEVNQPFLALKGDEAINRVTSMFNDIMAIGGPLMVLGGGRDLNNIVEGGADESIHKQYGALDLLKTKSAMYLAGLSPTKLKEYGISKILTNYDNHIHIEFDNSILTDFKPN